MPLYPSKCYELGNVPQFFFSFVVFTFGLAFAFFEECGGASFKMPNYIIIISKQKPPKKPFELP